MYACGSQASAMYGQGCDGCGFSMQLRGSNEGAKAERLAMDWACVANGCRHGEKAGSCTVRARTSCTACDDGRQTYSDTVQHKAVMPYSAAGGGLG